MSEVRQSRFRRSYRARSTDYRTFRSTDEVKFDIPTIDNTLHYGALHRRHMLDIDHIKPYSESQLNLQDSCPPTIIPDRLSREPSYTKFKVPFQMICHERYAKASKIYEQQFSREINKIIDNQPTAREATYFVRIVSYTTLWPPYHNERELVDTSQSFYKLTPKEHARFNFIMSNDFSYL